MHKQITSEKEPIYDVSKAILIYDKNPTLKVAKELAIWKQDNIEEGCKEGAELDTLKELMGHTCGYCFKYLKESCWGCPLFKKFEKSCFKLSNWINMGYSFTHADFLKHHRAWRKQLGLYSKK